MSPLRSIWLDILTPSAADERPYNMLTTGVSHAMLGALFVAPTSGTWAAQIALTAAYWLIKEMRDLRKGGSVKDGLFDAIFFGIGTFYAGPTWWPLIIFLLGLLKPYIMRKL